MKILMIRWKSICEPDMMAAFAALGQEVTVWGQEIDDPDYDQKALHALAQTLLENHYDFVFTVDYFPIVARVCSAVKVRYVSWSVDCPVMQYYSKTLSLPYNRVFLFDYAMYEEFVKENPEHIYYLPLGTNVKHNDEVMASITKEDQKRFTSQVSFIGSLYTEKCRYNQLTGLSEYTRGYANALLEAQLLIYGYNFLEEAMTKEFVARFCEEADWGQMHEDYREDDRALIAQMYLGEKVTEQERLRLLDRLSRQFPVTIYTQSNVSRLPALENRGSAESRREMPIIFHLSRINLNMTSKTIRTGLPQRFWDVLGAGGFLLSNMQAELPEYLVPGEDLETYSSFEECEEKIAYYLKHEEERQAIARRGYEKVKEHYTYEHRIAQMLTILEKEMSPSGA